MHWVGRIFLTLATAIIGSFLVHVSVVMIGWWLIPVPDPSCPPSCNSHLALGLADFYGTWGGLIGGGFLGSRIASHALPRLSPRS
jgi:hypothetical protein